mgnify:CR=1 FL=1
MLRWPRVNWADRPRVTNRPPGWSCTFTGATTSTELLRSVPEMNNFSASGINNGQNQANFVDQPAIHGIGVGNGGAGLTLRQQCAEVVQAGVTAISVVGSHCLGDGVAALARRLIAEAVGPDRLAVHREAHLVRPRGGHRPGVPARRPEDHPAERAHARLFP